MAVTITGTPAAAAATTLTLPAHAAGDIILLFGFKDGATSIPTIPTAGGTVPTWVTIDAPTGANLCAGACVYALATANNHTSGTWTGATGLAGIVIRGAKTASPIGGHAQGNGTGLNTCTAPSITVQCADGQAIIVAFGGNRVVTAWGTPAGYTVQASVATEVTCCSKTSSTSDGSLSLACTNVNSGSGFIAQHVEILPEAPAVTFVSYGAL